MSLGDILDAAGGGLKYVADEFGKGGDQLDAFLNQHITKPIDNALGTNFAGMQSGGNPFQMVANTGQFLTGAPLAAVEKVPYVGDAVQNTMHWLNYGNRAVNTALITAAHAGAVSDKISENLGEFLNSDAWSKAWRVTDDQGDGGVTGGQVLSNALFGDNKLDPLGSQQEVSRLQANATSSWYGMTLATTSDLLTSFVAPPGLGAVGKVKNATVEARTVGSLADAEAVAARAAQMPVLNGEIPSAFQKMRDTADVLNPFSQQNIDSVIQRQVAGLRSYEGVTSVSDAMKVTDKLLGNVGTAHMRSQFADVMTQIAKSPELDLAARDRMRLNASMAFLGSATAKQELIREAPILAKNIENLTTNPVHNDIASEMWAHASMNPGEPLPINEIVDRHFGPRSWRAEAEAIALDVEKKAAAFENAKQYLKDVKANPVRPNQFDALHLGRVREQADLEVKAAREELRTANQALLGTRRWASASFKKATADSGSGALTDVADYHAALGDARTVKEAAEKRLEQALSDRDLLNQTPMPGSKLDPARGEFDAQVAFGEEQKRAAKLDVGLQEAYLRMAQKADRMDLERRNHALSDPHLRESNGHLNNILDLSSEGFAAEAASFERPTLRRGLDWMRLHYADSTDVHYGAGNSVARVVSLPSTKAQRMLAPRARGQVNLRDISLGMRQMEDGLRRSRHFTTEEIRKASDELVGAGEADRVHVVEKYHDIMLTRMAEEFVRDAGKVGVDGELLTGKEALKKALEIVKVAKRAWGEGSEWLTREAAKPVKGNLVPVRSVDGEVHLFNGPALQSMLADNSRWIDPGIFRRELKLHTGSRTAKAADAIDAVINSTDFALRIWKSAVLLRPGLMVRSYLDTGARMVASIGAMTAFQQTLLGAAHMLHNRNPSAYLKARLSGQPLADVAAEARYLGLRPVRVKVGKNRYEHRLVRDVADQESLNMALAKGNSVHGALMTDMARKYQLETNPGSWVPVKPTDENWNVAYQQFAAELLASPTIRKIADLAHNSDHVVALDDSAFRAILDDPAVLAEYRKTVNPRDMTTADFVTQAWTYVNDMFPTKELYDAARGGKVSKKFLDRAFPTPAVRPTIPGPEMSVIGGNKLRRLMQRVVDDSFGVLLDRPDMWLGRVPTATARYRSAIRDEYAAFEKRFGKDYELSVAEVRAIDARAKHSAVNYVRDTFFDTTRYTSLHAVLGRIAPFFNAWEDSLMSWGKIIYNNPQTIARLQAAYHAPFVVQDSLHTAIVVDRDGNPLGRDNKSDSAEYVNVPLAWALGSKGIDSYRFRLASLNSITFGEQWASPGVGPLVQIPAGLAVTMNPHLATAIMSTDSELGKTLREQVFFGGDVPVAESAVDVLKGGLLPPWVRNFYNNAAGKGHMQAAVTYFNYKVAEANAKGINPTRDDFARWRAESEKAADAATLVQWVGQFGLGLSGSAAVDGHFYAEQLHIAQAMTPEQRGGLDVEAYLVQQFPEMAGLSFSVTSNDTGVTASLHAEKAYQSMQSIVDRYDKADKAEWLVLGADNLVDPEFSRTAYGLQMQRGARRTLTPDEVMNNAMEAVGWRQYDTLVTQINAELESRGVNLSSKKAKQARAAARDDIMAENPAFARAVNSRTSDAERWRQIADELSDPKNGPLRNRSDMVAYRDYMAARTEVLDRLKIKSLTGSSDKYVQARSMLFDLGTRMSERDLGFSQMWSRWLSKEVD